ncbi:MAG: methyl-accepting chemotaxis protein [Gammaproteobacteria bacterium]|jgi:twitching motility protein PilJ|nr:methyl-accepting chemotaxis protein [Gammaproteobacteria bacterium]MDX2460513.1 methyl-accepting chemotaxis protein [Gammaproteobacteria bacterium]
MIRRLKIAPRLLVLISVQGLILLLTGAILLGVLNFASKTARSLNYSVDQVSKVTALAEGLRNGLVNTVQETNAGTITWAEGLGRIELARADFDAAWKIFSEGHDRDEQELMKDVLIPELAGVREAFDTLKPIFEAQSRSRLALFLSNDIDFLVGPFLDALVASSSLRQIDAELISSEASDATARYLSGSIAVIVMGLLLSAILAFAIYRSIAQPLGQIASAVQEVSEGNFESRTFVDGPDELGALGYTFDAMLNDRVGTLAKAQEENEQLNNAVVQLLQGVYQLSQRDLTIKVAVTEDVTGPVADSLNLLTIETAKVLQGVTDISYSVAATSDRVKEQSDNVIEVATAEQKEVEKTAAELSETSESMLRIAKLARACAEAADKATKSTASANESVTDTVTGITAIRETIRETEKRIKRLGERSQEINRVVNLINTIAERTHILALNASMHAASAGEAGRGFVVVADEVQRLAESAREATLEISTLVNNIQVETADTVATMNDAISQVVDGTKLAEQAGSRMQETEKSTSELVAMVQQIAKRSRDQAVMSSELRGRAEQIVISSQGTNDRLREQTTDTNQLVEFSQKLLAAVSVFKLPEVTTDAGTRLHDKPDSADPNVAKAPDSSIATFPDNKAAVNA